MVGLTTTIMDVDTNRTFIDDLFSNDEEKCFQAIIQLKSALIGSNKAKNRVIEAGVVPRLLNLLTEPTVSHPDLKVAVAYALGSIAKGSDQHLKVLLDCDVVPVLLNCVVSSREPRFVEACLCCLRTLFYHPDVPVEVLYTDPALISHLLALMPLSTSNQISVASILMHSCKIPDHQTALTSQGAVTAIHLLLLSPLPDVQLPALQCLAFLVFGNPTVASVVAASALEDGHSLVDAVVTFMDRHHKVEMQLAAARVVSYLNRCDVLDNNDPKVIYKALPTVVRLTHKVYSAETRILAADTLAFLIETSPELQRVAAISNHLIQEVASFLWYEATSDNLNITNTGDYGFLNSNGGGFSRFSRMEQLIQQPKRSLIVTPAGGPGIESHNLGKEMKRSAFRVFSALAASDEDIRKKIIETDNLMDLLVISLHETDNNKLQMAAVGCLHSLSRSVQLLRTTFQDHPVWKPLISILESPNSSAECQVLASSTLCDLLLEFSPSKEPILDSGAIDLLCQLTHKYDPSLRLNGVWGLMNMAFQSDQRIKVQIITALGADQIFRLLSDSDINIVMKTLGLLRNEVAHKSQIDHVMGLFGEHIMQAVVLILESDNNPDVKEQALCILANIADGDNAKSYIMANEDVLKKVTNYLMHTNTKLQMAAVVCVYNLAYIEEPGAGDRQTKLREVGVHKILGQLLNTPDANLSEKAKAAHQQFA
jgi:hypothetical protein